MPIPPSRTSGDGASGPAPEGPAVGGPLAYLPRPVPPGQLVVVEVVPASEVDPGPKLPLYLDRVPAGFPSPADDYVEGRLDLLDLTNARSPSSYFVRAAGESMTGAGIEDGDVLVVDRALDPVSGAVVVASVDGELTVKRFVRRGRRVSLLAANPDYPPIELQDGQDLVVWGVVTHSLRTFPLRP